jgi:hypothetical protein
MKKLLILSVAVLLVAPVFAGTVTTVGNTDLEISGGLRIRWDYYNNIYDFSDHEDGEDVDDPCPSRWCDDDFSYTPWRANVVLKALVTRNVDVVVNLQGVDYFGGNEMGPYSPYRGIAPFSMQTLNGNGDGPPLMEGVPGAGQQTDFYDGLGVFEAYIHTRNAWDSNWSFKLGRQAVALGNKLLVGDNTWYDGTSFDGLLASWAIDAGDVHLFWFKVYSLTGLDYSNEDDGNLHGVYTTWDLTDRQGIDAYLLLANFNVDATQNAGIPDMEFLTLGARWFSKEAFGGFDWTAELAYQDASYDIGGGAEGDDIDGNGMLFDGEIGYTFDSDYEPRLAFGLTYITGDDTLDGADDGENRDQDGFFRLYGDSHGRWGNADLLYSSVLAPTPNGDVTSPLWDNALPATVGPFNTPTSGASAGAIIPQLKFSMKANDSIRWGANLVYIMAAESDFQTADIDGMIDGDDADEIIKIDDTIAFELDAWLTYQYSEHFGMVFNISYIDVGDFVGDVYDALNADNYEYDDGEFVGVEDSTDYGEDEAYRMYASFLVKW